MLSTIGIGVSEYRVSPLPGYNRDEPLESRNREEYP